MSAASTQSLLKSLFDAQRFAVLATQRHGAPYGNLIAFAATTDLRHLLFVTPRTTHKYGNLKTEPRVAVLIDNRSNRASDIQTGLAVTALGVAIESNECHRNAFLETYMARHPELEDFARHAGSSFFHISVERYVVVDHFQHVVETSTADWREVPHQ